MDEQENNYPNIRREVRVLSGSTHDELCSRAAKWLQNTCKCRLVLREVVSYARETPDAIGWRWGSSILVECKTSRSDFAADRKKPVRFANAGMGEQRYYMTDPGLLRVDEIPDGWGLLEVHGKQVRVVKESPKRELMPTYYRDELQHMVRGLRMANGQDEKPVKRSETIVGDEEPPAESEGGMGR